MDPASLVREGSPSTPKMNLQLPELSNKRATGNIVIQISALPRPVRGFQSRTRCQEFSLAVRDDSLPPTGPEVSAAGQNIFVAESSQDLLTDLGAGGLKRDGLFFTSGLSVPIIARGPAMESGVPEFRSRRMDPALLVL